MRYGTRSRLAQFTMQSADSQTELVADFHDFAGGDRAVAHAQFQRLVARLVELDDRAGAELDDFLNRFPLSGQSDPNGHANLQQAAGVRGQAVEGSHRC